MGPGDEREPFIFDVFDAIQEGAHHTVQRISDSMKREADSLPLPKDGPTGRSRSKPRRTISNERRWWPSDDNENRQGSSNQEKPKRTLKRTSSRQKLERKMSKDRMTRLGRQTRTLSQEEIVMVHAVFERLDVDGNGTLVQYANFL